MQEREREKRLEEMGLRGRGREWERESGEESGRGPPTLHFVSLAQCLGRRRGEGIDFRVRTSKR